MVAVDPPDRQLVEELVQRVEINPETQNGEVILTARLADSFCKGSTRMLSAEHSGVLGMRYPPSPFALECPLW